MLNKILFAIALGFFAGLTTANADPTPVAGARVKGRIIAVRVRGHVDAITKADGQKRTLHDGDSVTEQTEIVTGPGANIILVFSNGAAVNVIADSTLDIEQFDQDPFSAAQRVSTMRQEPGTSTTRLSLTRGELVGKVVHLNVDKGSEFTVQTPVGAAGIRGTTFMIVFHPGPNGTASFSVSTTDGTVVFTGTTTQPVAIPAGKKIQVTFDINSGIPAEPIVLTDLPPAEAALIEALAHEIENSLLDVVFPPFGNNGPNGNGGAGGNGNGNGNGTPASFPNNAPSLPAVPAPATTPGAGGP
jgi:hypothetical protein